MYQITEEVKDMPMPTKDEIVERIGTQLWNHFYT